MENSSEILTDTDTEPLPLIKKENCIYRINNWGKELEFEKITLLEQRHILNAESRNLESRLSILPKLGPLQMISSYVCGPRLYVFGGEYFDHNAFKDVGNDTIYYYEIYRNKWVICPVEYKCSSEISQAKRHGWRNEEYRHPIVTDFADRLGVFTFKDSRSFSTTCSDFTNLPSLSPSKYRVNMVGCELDKNTTMIFSHEIIPNKGLSIQIEKIPTPWTGNILSSSNDHWITHRFSYLASLESYSLVCTANNNTVSLVGKVRTDDTTYSRRPVHYHYDYQSDQWLDKCVAPISLSKGLTINNNLYAMGKSENGSELIFYDPRENRWQHLNPPSQRSLTCYEIASFEDKIWCTGGEVSFGDDPHAMNAHPTTQVTLYDIRANRWDSVDTSMPDCLFWFGCKIIE